MSANVPGPYQKKHTPSPLPTVSLYKFSKASIFNKMREYLPYSQTVRQPRR